jgi:1-acyl-sn-glycerol-3-phosphate acyltransferase
MMWNDENGGIFMLLGISALVSALLSCGVCALTGCFGNLHWLWVLPLGFVVSMGLCALAVLVFLVVICKGVDQTKPQEEDDPFFRRTAYAVIDAVAALARIKIVTSGLEKTPKDGRFLLVCNHLNDIDPPVLLKCFKKSQLAFISKRENQSLFIVGPLMHKILCQPINRENDREALKTILRCIQIIKEDKASIAVFPEGYTSMDGLLHPFRSGVFKIAQKANVPIVVCTLRDTQYVLKRAMKLKPSTVELRLLDVIPAEDLKGRTAVDIGEQVHKMMADDLGPDLVLKTEE